jgi:hypothetical protein
MFWGFLLLTGLGASLVKLGAVSAWVSILSLALKICILIFLGMGILVLWRRLKN